MNAAIKGSRSRHLLGHPVVQILPPLAVGLEGGGNPAAEVRVDVSPSVYGQRLQGLGCNLRSEAEVDHAGNSESVVEEAPEGALARWKLSSTVARFKRR